MTRAEWKATLIGWAIGAAALLFTFIMGLAAESVQPRPIPVYVVNQP